MTQSIKRSWTRLQSSCKRQLAAEQADLARFRREGAAVAAAGQGLIESLNQLATALPPAATALIEMADRAQETATKLAALQEQAERDE